MGYELTPRDHLLISGSATNLTIAAGMTNVLIEMKPAPIVDTLLHAVF